MTLLKILALLTFTVTVAYETIDVTLKFLQYIESKHNKKRLTANAFQLVRSIFFDCIECGS